MQFPMIGEPGAEKILLFCGLLNVLALESNGLRVLTRLGCGEERKELCRGYKSVREVTLRNYRLTGRCSKRRTCFCGGMGRKFVCELRRCATPAR